MFSMTKFPNLSSFLSSGLVTIFKFSSLRIVGDLLVKTAASTVVRFFGGMWQCAL